VVSLSFGRLNEAFLFALLAVGMRSNAYSDADWTSSSLECLCIMWDCCRLLSRYIQFASVGAQGIEEAPLVIEFRLLVAACDQCDDRLEILTKALAHHPTLTGLRLRCLVSGFYRVGGGTIPREQQPLSLDCHCHSMDPTLQCSSSKKQ
jgi:hypothetical protein